MKYLLIILLFTMALTGCTQVIKPENIAGADRLLTPSDAVSEGSRHKGKKVLWGGVIINNHESEGLSVLELSYLPVDNEGIPQIGDQGEDIYLVETNDYLDNIEYSEGRYLTLAGELISTRVIKDNSREFVVPVLSPREIYLWDSSKFSRKQKKLNQNPYADTYQRAVADRPFEAVKDPLTQK